MTIEYEIAEIRFGFFATFIAQIVGLTAAFLNIQNEEQKISKGFSQGHHTTTPPQE